MPAQREVDNLIIADYWCKVNELLTIKTGFDSPGMNLLLRPNPQPRRIGDEFHRAHLVGA